MPEYRCRSGVGFDEVVTAANPNEAFFLAAELLRDTVGGIRVGLFTEVTGPGVESPLLAPTAFLVREMGGLMSVNLVAEVPPEANDAGLAWMLGLLPSPECWEGEAHEHSREEMLKTVRGNLEQMREMESTPTWDTIRLIADRLMAERPMMEIAAKLDFSERPDSPLGAEAGVAAVLALLETASEDGATDRDVILAAWAAEYFATMISAHNK